GLLRPAIGVLVLVEQRSPAAEVRRQVDGDRRPADLVGGFEWSLAIQRSAEQPGRGPGQPVARPTDDATEGIERSRADDELGVGLPDQQACLAAGTKDEDIAFVAATLDLHGF